MKYFANSLISLDIYKITKTVNNKNKFFMSWYIVTLLKYSIKKKTFYFKINKQKI